MAIARCEKHTPDGSKHNYKVFALPIGHPDTAVVCGRVECEAPARLWLTEPEGVDHQRGTRIFNIRTHSAKVRVFDKLASS